MDNYGIGKIEEGKWKGKRFLIPTTVMVEKPTVGGKGYAKACIKCCEWLSDQEWKDHKCDK